MSKKLLEIQRLVRAGKIALTRKALEELEQADLDKADVVSVILNADHITDAYTSNQSHEMLYVL